MSDRGKKPKTKMVVEFSADVVLRGSNMRFFAMTKLRMSRIVLTACLPSTLEHMRHLTVRLKTLDMDGVHRVKQTKKNSREFEMKLIVR